MAENDQRSRRVAAQSGYADGRPMKSGPLSEKIGRNEASPWQNSRKEATDSRKPDAMTPFRGDSITQQGPNQDLSGAKPDAQERPRQHTRRNVDTSAQQASDQLTRSTPPLPSARLGRGKELTASQTESDSHHSNAVGLPNPSTAGDEKPRVRSDLVSVIWVLDDALKERVDEINDLTSPTDFFNFCGRVVECEYFKRDPRSVTELKLVQLDGRFYFPVIVPPKLVPLLAATGARVCASSEDSCRTLNLEFVAPVADLLRQIDDKRKEAKAYAEKERAHKLAEELMATAEESPIDWGDVDENA